MTKYFSNHKDIRDYLNSHFMNGSLKYKFVNPDTRIKYQGQLLKPESIRRNSIEGRMRIFVNNWKPIELSYCEVRDLADMINAEGTYLENKRNSELIEDKYAKVEPYVGKNLVDLYNQLGVCTEGYSESKYLVHDKDYYTSNIRDFEDILNKIDSYEMILSYVKTYGALTKDDFKTFSTKQKSEYFRVKYLLEKDKDLRYAYRQLDNMFEDSYRRYGNELVIEALWDKDISAFLKLLNEYDIHRILLMGNSSLVHENIWSFIDNGWRVSTNLIIVDKAWQQDNEVKVLELRND